MSKFLKDIQNLKDTRGIAIQKVGIKDVEIPLIIQRKNDANQVVSAKARMSVALPQNFKGTHMSRFMEVLDEWRAKDLLGVDIKGILKDLQKKLDAKSAHVRFTFKYFLKKEAPISKSQSVMGYECSFEGNINNEDYEFLLGVKVPVTTLCPCSKEISNYSAHNQRALIKIIVGYDEKDHIWLEDLIKLAESCGSCELYPILKREDEKYVTEKAYDNPKFVEDVIRDVILQLKANKIVKFFEVECEAFESIHNHSAWAFQQESLD